MAQDEREDRDDPTARALALLSCLTARAHWSGQELASRLGVTTRTVRRDVDRLRRLGYEIDAAAGTDGGYRLRAGAVVPPLFLDADEAVAVVTALLAASSGQTTGMADTSVRALAKLHHVLPTPVQRRADAVRRAARTVGTRQVPDVDPANIAVLAEACRDGVAVRFGYVARDGDPTSRRAEPHALVTLRDIWYLVAFDLDRDDWRMFRVDRMAGDVERTGHGIARRTPPGGDPLSFVGASLADIPYDLTAELEVGEGREQVLAALAWLNPRRTDEIDATSCRIRLGARDLADLTRQVIDVMAVAPLRSLRGPDVVGDHLRAVASALVGALDR